MYDFDKELPVLHTMKIDAATILPAANVLRRDSKETPCSQKRKNLPDLLL